MLFLLWSVGESHNVTAACPLTKFVELHLQVDFAVYSYEEFAENPQSVLRDFYSFLGVDKDYVTDVSYQPNAGGIPKRRFLQEIVMKPCVITGLIRRLVHDAMKRRIRDVVSNCNLEKPKFPEVAKGYLTQEVREEKLKLQVLLNRDLPAWLH